MNDKPGLPPPAEAAALPPFSEWQPQFIIHWRGGTYRLRLLDTAVPRWVVSVETRKGEYLYIASGRTEHEAIENAARVAAGRA